MRLTALASSFFFQCNGPPRDLHSFPTRRSSDLAPTPRARSTRSPPSISRCGTRSASRSEEHTSELQSLTNLVCRLLLEKKKRKQYKVKSRKKTPAQENLERH